jgi:hypothetical protein
MKHRRHEPYTVTVGRERVKVHAATPAAATRKAARKLRREARAARIENSRLAKFPKFPRIKLAPLTLRASQLP